MLLRYYSCDNMGAWTALATYYVMDVWQGLLALEGELPPILAQMVKSANMNGLLDNDNESAKYQNMLVAITQQLCTALRCIVADI